MSMYQRAPVKGKGKGGAAGAREVVSGSRVNGTIVEWKGNHGWVQPFYPVNHPDAAKKPYIFMSVTDIEQELDDMNPLVSFVVYSDGTGLGAQEVRQAGVGGFAGYGARSVQIAKASPWMAAGGGGKAAGKAGGKVASRVRMTHEQISEKVQGLLREGLWEAVQEVATLEETWSPEELLKRVVRYLYKSPMGEDPTTGNWSEGVRKFVTKATDSYNRSCSEKGWYGVLDITPGLSSAAWAIAEACEGYPRPKKEEVETLVSDLHHSQIHKIQLDKIMWEGVELSFPVGEKRQEKLWKALSNSYNNAFDAGRAGQSAGGFQRAEKFLKSWITESLNRSWQGFGDEAETVFAVDTVVEFWKSMLVPGDESGFSCIPPPFVDGERTGEEWDVFLRATVTAFLEQYANPQESAASAKRRKKAEAAEEVDPEIAAIDAELAALMAGT